MDTVRPNVTNRELQVRQPRVSQQVPQLNPMAEPASPLSLIKADLPSEFKYKKLHLLIEILRKNNTLD